MKHMVYSPQDCEAGKRAVFVRNIAARALVRSFTIEGAGLEGEVEVRRSMLPFFIAASTERMPLKSGMVVRRKFFDASFELAITPSRAGKISVS